MLTRQQKADIISELAEILRRDATALFLDYRSVNTQGMRELRKKLREHGGIIRVVRKTLFRRALSEAGLPNVSHEALRGQIAVAYGFSDPVGAAKAIRAFQKELERALGKETGFVFRGGMLSGMALGATEAAALAVIPSRTELLTQLVVSLSSPLHGFVSVLYGPQRSFVHVLSAKAKVEN